MTLQEQRYSLPEEAPIQAGPFKLRPKVWFWGVLFALLTFVALTIGARKGALAASFVFCCLLWALYIAVFVPQLFESLRTTPFAFLYRFGVHKGAGVLGLNEHMSLEAETGEPFQAVVGKGKKPPRPEVIAHIGKVSFKPFVADPNSPPIGVVVDKRYQTYSGVLKVSGRSLLIAEPGKDGPELQGLQRLLDELANVDFYAHRLTWRDQTVFGEPQQPDKLVEALRRGAGLHGQTDLPHTDLMKRRTAETCEAAVRHNTTVVLTVHRPQVARQARKLGGVEQVLLQQLATFYNSAMGAGNNPSPVGWRTAGLLSYPQLLWENRFALDPVFAKGYWDTWQDSTSAIAPQENVAWPKTADFSDVAYCRLGNTYHTGFYVASFPKEGITLEQLWEIQKVEVPRTIATVLEMVPEHIARRRAEWASNGIVGTQIERQEKHRRITAKQKLAADEVQAHEQTIAARNQVGRVRCYIDVTGSTLAEMKEHAAEIEKAAFPSGCTLEPLTARQVLGIETIAPYGRGLAGRSRKWSF